LHSGCTSLYNSDSSGSNSRSSTGAGEAASTGLHAHAACLWQNWIKQGAAD